MDKEKWENLLKEEIRRRNYSYKTEQAYVQWVQRYWLYLEQNKLKEINEQTITAYLNYLADTRHMTTSIQNQGLCAILLL